MRFPTALALCTLLLAPVAQAGDISGVVTIQGEVAPGVYGRVVIGNAPPPPVLYVEPLIVVREPRPVPLAPVYLHVPPGHAKNWSKHCQRYGACSHPVLFVKSAEYEPGYKPKKPKKEKG